MTFAAERTLYATSHIAHLYIRTSSKIDLISQGTSLSEKEAPIVVVTRGVEVMTGYPMMPLMLSSARLEDVLNGRLS